MSCHVVIKAGLSITTTFPRFTIVRRHDRTEIHGKKNMHLDVGHLVTTRNDHKFGFVVKKSMSNSYNNSKHVQHIDPVCYQFVYYIYSNDGKTRGPFYEDELIKVDSSQGEL